MGFDEWAWGRVDYWSHANIDMEDDPFKPLLLAAWDAMDEAVYNGTVGRTRAEIQPGFRDFRNPLEAAFSMMSIGEYPPPELVWALLDCWQRYIDSRGELSLEAAFFGPARPRVGNFSGREHLSHKRKSLPFLFRYELAKDGDRMAAAQRLSERLGGSPEPESILRMLRGVGVAKPPEKFPAIESSG